MKTKYYYVYWDKYYVCVSSNIKTIEKYIKKFRKIRLEDCDIFESNRHPTEEESSRELVSAYGILMTERDCHIIGRDFKTFMDNTWDARNNLIEVNNLLPKRKKCSGEYQNHYWLEYAQDVYDNVIEKNGDPLIKRFFLNHQLSNMNMPTYIAYSKMLPNYFSDY